MSCWSEVCRISKFQLCVCPFEWSLAGRVFANTVIAAIGTVCSQAMGREGTVESVKDYNCVCVCCAWSECITLSLSLPSNFSILPLLPSFLPSLPLSHSLTLSPLTPLPPLPHSLPPPSPSLSLPFPPPCLSLLLSHSLSLTPSLPLPPSPLHYSHYSTGWLKQNET